MATYNMRKAVPVIEEPVGEEVLTDEVVDYLHRVADISLMDDQFWADFILGACLWSLQAGYVGVW